MPTRTVRPRPMFKVAMIFLAFVAMGIIPANLILPGSLLIVFADVCMPWKEIER